jgi:predicted RND superfamily exporter protein
MLTGMIPPLIIVIGIPNSIFMLNKYHQEVRKHGNKIKALQRVIQKIGSATFLTNFTTAIGFGTFMITNSRLLVEFGIITSINIMFIFVISILLIPIVFSFISTPTEKSVKHLDNKWLANIINNLLIVSLKYRKPVFIIAPLLLIAGVFGISRIETTGYMLDDVPRDKELCNDLKFFEQNFRGLMPLEIMVDTKKSNGILQISNMQKVDKLQDTLATMTELSKSLSYIEIVKFARQAYYNGIPQYFGIPSRQEQNFIMSYLQNEKTGNEVNQIINTFIDSTRQKMRISLRMADIGTVRMETLNNEINQIIEEILPQEDYDTLITGSSVLFFKGTSYLIRNLLVSLFLAIFLIASFIAIMFKSKRMVLASLIPNFFPLVITAALMGIFGIPIKTSTVLVFSVAFGISVDGTIHFLAKYRQELGDTNWSMRAAVVVALKEAGVSMIYTYIILLAGFGIFCLSDFGGTAALGMLVGLTLLIALFSNLILLPSLLISMERRLAKKSFKKPFIEIFNDDDDE